MFQIMPGLDYREGGGGGDVPDNGQSMAEAGQSIFNTS